MKKIISISALVAVSVLSADSSYRIYVGTFSKASSGSNIEALKDMLGNKLANSNNVLGIDSVVRNGKTIVFIDTKPVSKDIANGILGEVKGLKGYSSAFMRVRKDAEPVVAKPSQESVKSVEVKKEEVELAPIAPVNEAEIMPKTIDKELASMPVLTLESAVKETLANNPGLKEIEYNYIQVGKDLNIAQNAFYPTLDAIATAGYSHERIDNDIRVRKDDGKRISAELVLTQNLFNGGADKNRVKSQSARLDSTAYSVAQKADRLTLELVDAYLNVIKNKKILEIEEQSVKTHEDIYNQIKDRAQSGFGVASEERQAGSRYTLAQTNLISAQNNYSDALSTFEKLYGKRVEAESLTMPYVTTPIPATEELVLEKARLCNPSLLVQKSNIAMAESVSKERNAAFLPKVDLELSGKYDNSSVFYKNYEGGSANALVKFRYNLYNKNSDMIEKEKAEVAVKQSNETLNNLNRELGESLKFSWQSYSLEQKKMAYLNEHVEYAKATLDSYQDEFRIGRRDLINLLDAQNEYDTALKEIITSEVALTYAKYRLLDNMGMITDSFEPGFAKRYIQGACSIENDLR